NDMNKKELLDFWEQIFMDKKIINIDNMLMDPRPNLYNISGNYLNLQFPFSSYFMEQIDQHKKLYNEELILLYEQPENLDENENLRSEKMKAFLKKFSNNILAMIPALTPTILQLAGNLYFKDFVTTSSTNSGYSNESDNERFGIHLIDQVCKMMLENIIKLKNENVNDNITANDLREWQRQVTNVLTLCANIETSSKLKALQFLRISDTEPVMFNEEIENIEEVIDEINLAMERPSFLI
ncbi:2283_t:CDS:2, partial [Dentiscutata erythropus]